MIKRDNPWQKYYGDQRNSHKNEVLLRRLEVGEPYQYRGRFLPTSGTFSRGEINALDYQSRNIEPRNTDFTKKGSVPGVLADGSFGVTYTDTTATIWWDGTNSSVVFKQRRPDQSVQVIIPSHVAITGLQASTTYGFLPYFATRGCGIGFVAGDSGSPRILFTAAAETAEAAAQQSFQDREALALGYVHFTTAAPAGTGSTTNGGSNRIYPDGCPRIGSLVKSLTRGLIAVELAHVGELIETPKGFVPVKATRITPCSEWVMIVTNEGYAVEQSSGTPQPLCDGSEKNVEDLALSDKLIVKEGYSPQIDKLFFIHDDGFKCELQLEGGAGEHPMYFCGYEEAVVGILNQLWKF